jgi:3-hydroxybutyryl-CoA dehydrogenase
MKVEDIKQVVVIGAGRMGSQLAQLFSQAGKYPVNMVDANDELVSKGMQSIEANLKRFFVDKEKMTQAEMDEIRGRIKGMTNIAEAVKDADFVVEAVFENLELKKNIFEQLGENAPAQAVLASNTSGLNITEMGSVTKKPDKVVGMHFFNPVARMKLVEVVRGSFTSDETVDTVVAMAKKLGKEPVVCKDFSPGFLANRAVTPIFHEAMQMVWERVATPADIDKAVKLGYNFPMGPLELGDMIGAWAIMAQTPDFESLHPLMKMMARAGYGGGPGKKGIYAFWDDVLSKF